MSTLRTVVVIATMSIVGLHPSASAGRATAVAPDEEVVGGIGLRLAEAPVSAGDDPRARVYIVDHLPPGTSIERQIEVSNTTTSPQQVALYAAAAAIDDGTFVGAAGATPNELSTWTSVTPDESTVAADGTLTATITIAVPADAAPGEQYGVLWAEARSAPSPVGGVVQVSRVGIRLYISVGPGGAPAADFRIDSLTAERSADSLPVITASVHNTGGRALDMNGTLLLSNGPGGLTAGPYAVDLGRTLAIGDTQPVHVTLDDRLPAGPWDASITLESGLTSRTAEATITFPDSGTAAPVNTHARRSTMPWLPLTTVGVLLLLVASGVVGLARRRRRRRVVGPLSPVPPFRHADGGDLMPVPAHPAENRVSTR